jgi:hypothetical protein
MKTILLMALGAAATIPLGYLFGYLYALQQFGILLLVFIATVALYATFLNWANDVIKTALDGYDLARYLQPNELELAGARSEAPAVEDRRLVKGLPKFIPGSDTPANQVAESPAGTPRTTARPYFRIELRKRLITGAITVVETHHNMSYQKLGSEAIAHIKAFVEKDPSTNLVRITPFFDLRMWNLEQRQSRATNVATIAAHFPRHLMKNVEGLIY